MNTVLINISNENNLRARLKVVAALKGETMIQMATNAIEAVVFREEQKQKQPNGDETLSGMLGVVEIS